MVSNVLHKAALFYMHVEQLWPLLSVGYDFSGEAGKPGIVAILACVSHMETARCYARQHMWCADHESADEHLVLDDPTRTCTVVLLSDILKVDMEVEPGKPGHNPQCTATKYPV